MFARALLVATMASASPSSAPPQHIELPPPRAAVEIEASDSASAWFSSGLEEMVKREIVLRRNAEIAPKVERDACPSRETACLVDKYRAAGVAVVVLGRVDRHAVLSYEIHDTSNDAHPAFGTLRLAAEPQAA